MLQIEGGRASSLKLSLIDVAVVAGEREDAEAVSSIQGAAAAGAAASAARMPASITE